jgi:hypothetical protein
MTKDEALAFDLALEALEGYCEHGSILRPLEVRDAIKQARSAPVQEPVAWMFQHEETGRTMCVDAQQVEWGFEKSNPRLKKIAPLYTTPPAQRQWVGLTEQEAAECWSTGTVRTWQAIEAKLKEKNT